MNCEVIHSKFGGKLLYVPSERMLYVSKGERNRVEDFVCYQTVLKGGNKKDNSEHIPCTSRVRLLPNGSCVRVNSNINHTNHPNHQLIAADKRKMHNMKQCCQSLKENHPETAFKIPNRHIYQREIAK